MISNLLLTVKTQKTLMTVPWGLFQTCWWLCHCCTPWWCCCWYQQQLHHLYCWCTLQWGGQSHLESFPHTLRWFLRGNKSIKQHQYWLWYWAPKTLYTYKSSLYRCVRKWKQVSLTFCFTHQSVIELHIFQTGVTTNELYCGESGSQKTVR